MQALQKSGKTAGQEYTAWPNWRNKPVAAELAVFSWNMSDKSIFFFTSDKLPVIKYLPLGYMICNLKKKGKGTGKISTDILEMTKYHPLDN